MFKYILDRFIRKFWHKHPSFDEKGRGITERPVKKQGVVTLTLKASLTVNGECPLPQLTAEKTVRLQLLLIMRTC